MPDHVHLLITEPENRPVSIAIQVMKQRFSRAQTEEFVWEPRYYDFNVRTEKKRIEKLRYIHRNPVTRGLVAAPADWPWSSFRAYALQESGPVTVTTS
jgi:putative transposase